MKVYYVELRVKFLHFFNSTSAVTLHKHNISDWSCFIYERILWIVKLILKITLEFTHLSSHLLNLFVVFSFQEFLGSLSWGDLGLYIRRDSLKYTRLLLLCLLVSGYYCSTFPFWDLFLKLIYVFLILFHLFCNTSLLLSFLHFANEFILFIWKCLIPYIFNVRECFWWCFGNFWELFIHSPSESRCFAINILFKGLTPGLFRFFLSLCFFSFWFFFWLFSRFLGLLLCFRFREVLLRCFLLTSFFRLLLFFLLTRLGILLCLFSRLCGSLSSFLEKRREWIQRRLSTIDIFIGILLFDFRVIWLE